MSNQLEIIIKAKDLASKVLNTAKTRMEALDKASGRVASRGFATMKRGAEKAAGAIKALAMVGAAAAVGLLAGGLKLTAEYEKMTVALTTQFKGNTEAVAEAQEQIKQFAKTTPYAMTEVMGAFIKMKSYGIEPTEEAMTAYGNTASAMGKDLDQMIEAVADAATGEFERLKEFGIKSSKQGDQVAFTFRGITTTVGNNSEEIQGYLKDIGNTDFAGSMAEQAKTWNGVKSNMVASFQEIIRKVTETSGIFGSLKRAMQTATDWMTENEDEIIAFVDEWGAKIKNFVRDSWARLTGAFEYFRKRLYPDLKEAFKNIYTVLKNNKAIILALAVGFGILLASIFPITGAIAAGAAALLVLAARWKQIKGWLDTVMKIPIVKFLKKEFGKAINDVKKEVEGIRESMRQWWELMSPVLLPVLKGIAIVLGGIVVGAIYAVIRAVQGIMIIIRSWIGRVNWAINTFNSLRAVVGSVFNSIRGSIANAVNDASYRFRLMQSAASYVFNVIKGAAYNAFVYFRNQAINAINNIKAYFNGLVSWFWGIPGRVGSAMWGVTNAIVAPFQDAYNRVVGIVDNINYKISQVKSSASNIGSNVSSSASNAWSNVTSWRPWANARGGMITNTSSGFINEEQGELVTLPSGSEVYSGGRSRNIVERLERATQGGGMGGSQTININMNFGGSFVSTPSQKREFVSSIEDALDQVVLRKRNA